MAELLEPSVARQRQLLGFPLVDSDIATGANINAAKIGTGVVDNTEFNRLNGITSALEEQGNKGAVSGYAGLDASQELLLTNFPAGTGNQFLRRNAGNTALEFATIVLTTTLEALTDTTITTRAANEVLVVNGANTAWINALLTNVNLSSGVFAAITGLGVQSQDLDMGGFDLTDLSNLQFRETPTSTPASTINFIQAKTGSGIVLNTNAGLFEIARSGTTVATFAAAIDFTDKIVNSIGGLTFVDANTSIQQSTLDLQLDVATGGIHDLRINNISEYSFNAAQAEFNDNNIIGVGNIELLATASAAPAGTIRWFHGTNGGIEYNVPTGDRHRWLVNGVQIMTMSNTQFDFQSFTLQGAGDINFINSASVINWSAGESIGIESGDMIFDVTTGNTFSFDINGSPSVIISDNTVDITNAQLDVGTGSIRFNTATNTIDGVGNDLRYNVPTGESHLFLVQDATEYSFNATQADFLGNNLINVGFFESDATTPANTGAIRLGNGEAIAWRDAAGTGNIALQIDSSDILFVGGALVGIDLTSAFISNALYYETNATNPADAGQIRLGNAEILTWRNALNTNNGVFTYNALDDFSMSINGTVEYTFESNRLDFNSNFIVDVQGITLTNGASAGAIKMPNAGALTWRNQAGSSDAGGLQINAQDNFNFLKSNATVVIEIEANHTTPADGQVISQIDSIDDDDLGARVTYSRIRTVMQRPDNANKDAELFIDLMTDNSFDNYIALNEVSDGFITFKKTLDMQTSQIEWNNPGVSILGDSGGLIFDVNTSDNFELRVNNIVEYDFNATVLDMNNNNLDMGTGQIILGDVNTAIEAFNSGSIQYDVITTKSHVFRVNNVARFDINASAILLADGQDIQIGSGTGTEIGTATNQPIGFWGTTPVVQPLHIADPTGGATVDAEARTAIDSILAQMATTGMQAAS